MIEYSFKKWQPEPLVKPSMIRGRVVCIIVFIVSIWPDLSLCFADDLCQILGMFSPNSIGCVTKCGPAGILRKYNRQMYVRVNVPNLHTERFEVIF